MFNNECNVDLVITSNVINTSFAVKARNLLFPRFSFVYELLVFLF